MLSVVNKAECIYAECRYAECHYVECRGAYSTECAKQRSDERGFSSFIQKSFLSISFSDFGKAPSFLSRRPEPAFFAGNAKADASVDADETAVGPTKRTRCERCAFPPGVVFPGVASQTGVAALAAAVAGTQAAGWRPSSCR